MNEKTSFELVSEMNEAFGNPKGNPRNISWDRVRKQSLNIIDEFMELQVALGANNAEPAPGTQDIVSALMHILTLDHKGKVGLALIASALKEAITSLPYAEPEIEHVRDASRDIVVFTDGLHHFMGYDADEDMRSVITGVMSRFIKDDEDKEVTIAKHASKGVVEVYFEGSYPKMIMKSAVDQPDAPKGKFMKSASYHEPVFDQLKSK